MCDRAVKLTELVNRVHKDMGHLLDGRLMIGGLACLMPWLEYHLRKNKYKYVYSFSLRVSQDVHNPDGTVTKTAVFKHIGWV